MDPEQVEGPEQLLLRMAAGDTSALTFLATIIMGPNDAIPRGEALIVAECFAGLAATSGTPTARFTLAQVMLARSADMLPYNPVRADDIWWNAAALLFDLAKDGDMAAAASLLKGLNDRADAGDEEAAVLLNETIAILPPATLTAAKEFREKMEAEATAPAGEG
ncbi:MAG: hypothetical protein M3Q19_14580 [Pseudomonadota bacterium]|nr:hypothetical protein [Pseudomonadota bacterium]